MPDQKLTPEQVAGFEARAAAGERPQYEWEMDQHGIDGVAINSPGLEVQGDRNRWGAFGCVYHECVFTSPLAAQLAAEHLLAEKTRPLHVNDYTLKVLAERQSEIERLTRSVSVHCGQIEANERALASRAGEIAALREEVRSTNSHLAGNRVNLATMFDLKETYRARAEAAEARVSALESALAEAKEKIAYMKTDPCSEEEFPLAYVRNHRNHTLDNCIRILDAARAGGQG